jgi:5'-deoxynucleotidase YfbR-like HD superfamily hydrolase
MYCAITNNPEVPLRTIDERLDVLMSNLIPFEGNLNLRYSDLQPRYLQSEWGQQHANQPLRYSEHFGYDREQMLDDLGEDVNPIGHMRIVHNDMVGFGIDQVMHGSLLREISAADIAVARATALIHDVGESTHRDFRLLCGGTIGDIPYGQKTSEDRATERRITEKIITTLYADMPEWLQQRILSIIAHEEDSVTHTLLETAHAYGFYATGLQAGRIALAIQVERPLADNDDRIANLAGLAKIVTGRIRPKLEPLARDFPLLDKFLADVALTHVRIAEEL